MMILRTTAPSPFARKVKICARLTEVMPRIRVEEADIVDPEDSLRGQNPLGKIPVLILEDGTALYDSRVICEYLDSLSPGVSLLPQGDARWQALRLQALADGIMDASILIVYEKRFRPEEKWHTPWLERQWDKINRALAALNEEPPVLPKTPDIGHVTLACALGYQDLRFGTGWREQNASLQDWLNAFSDIVPAFAETEPSA